ncbi:MAG: hypothetical protein N2C12_07865 [Planctomycetales bacterium]
MSIRDMVGCLVSAIDILKMLDNWSFWFGANLTTLLGMTGRTPDFSDTQAETTTPGSRKPMAVAITALAATLILWLLQVTVGGMVVMVLFLLCQVVMISIVIWQACDPFADAAQWIGKKLHIPGSIRGATLDAVASSLPELFTGIFFVILPILLVADPSNEALQEGTGFAATVATCAGSAVYNMILIPAICAIYISYHRPARPTIDIEDKVIVRDGLWFLGCEFVLIYFLFQPAMVWWMALVLIGLYCVYVGILYQDARRYRRVARTLLQRFDVTTTTHEVMESLAADGMFVTRALVDKIRGPMVSGDQGGKEESEEHETAQILFGKFTVPLNGRTACAVILIATAVTAVACFWLVEVTRETSSELGIPIFFVAVILAAAASSVPDTFLSIGSAKRGDDDGAVSNAFGSNIFDICICLTVPLLLGSYLLGWKPIQITSETGEPLPGIYGLRILLCVLTLITLLIMWHNRQLTRRKAIVLCCLYAIFVGYAIAGSLGFTLERLVSGS